MASKPIDSTFNVLDLAISVLVEAMKDYRRRWRLYLGILALSWWPLILLEVWLLASFGAPVLNRLEPFLFRFSSDGPFDITKALADLDGAALLMFLGVVFGLAIFSSLVVQSVVGGALIRAATADISIRQAYYMPISRYLNLIGVSVLTLMLIGVPSLLLFLPLCGMLFLVTNLTGQPLLMVIAALLLLFGLFLLPVSALVCVVRFAIGPQAVVLEECGAAGALLRSWRLIHRWRPMFCVFLVSASLAVPSLLIGQVFPQIVRDLGWLLLGGHSLSLLSQFLISHAVAEFFSGLFLPLQTIALTLLFRRLSAIAPVVPQPAVGPLPQSARA